MSLACTGSRVNVLTPKMKTSQIFIKLHLDSLPYDGDIILLAAGQALDKS
jgi:hypothetical protein